MRCRIEAGFTLLEVVIVVALSIPVMMAVLGTSDMVARTLNTSSQRSAVAEELRTTFQRLTQMLRAASLSTVKTRAIQPDVDEAKALAESDPLAGIVIPTLGEWIALGEADTRRSILFRAASGELSMNAEALTEPRSLEFVMDANEFDNDLDDDGDGMVDEGRLYLDYETSKIVLADNVESCSFSVTDRTVKFTIRCARLDRSRRIHRMSAEHSIHLRNN